MASSLSEELLAIRVEMQGARKAAEESRDLAAAQKGIGTSTEKVGKAADKTSRKTGRLTKIYSALGKAARWGIGFLGVGAVFALGSAIKKTEDLAKTTAGLTRNLSLNTNVASRWGAVAQAREIDSKALTMSFTTLSRKLTEAAREGGTSLTAFHQIGISQEEAAKGSKNFSWFLGRLAEKFGDAEGGAKRQAAAQGLLGRGYATILPLFSEGSKGLQEQLHWADKYGVTLSTKTKDGLMAMVNAHRESKVAMLGLNIALTKALMPAIEMGEGELQQFIATLNSDDLSGDEKIDRIQRQFERLSNRLVQIIAGALPRVAEQGGQIGLKLAAAIWTGFKNSNLLGKAVIALWLFKVFGGGTLLSRMLVARYGSLGKISGKAFMGGLILGSVGIGFLLAEELDRKTNGGFRKWGIHAAQTFVNALIEAINFGIERINDSMDRANVLGKLGVDAPNIGLVDPVNFDETPGGGNPRHTPGLVPTPKGVNPGSLPGGHSLGISGRGARPRSNRISFRGLGLGGGSQRPIVVQSILDGKVIAESVTQHADDAAALA